jgi:signal transduction histidine kinase
MARDQASADALLAELSGDIEATITDIRRLVYDLRPPALDELGLVGAIRERVTQYHCRPAVHDRAGCDTILSVAVDAPESLPALPAAVEVAAYRIAHEALTNVVRHACARTCCVRLALEDGVFVLEIEDDGAGMPAERRSGVGLLSMRERAEELGGSLSVGLAPGGGTRVLARLPLPKE